MYRKYVFKVIKVDGERERGRERRERERERERAKGVVALTTAHQKNTAAHCACHEEVDWK